MSAMGQAWIGHDSILAPRLDPDHDPDLSQGFPLCRLPPFAACGFAQRPDPEPSPSHIAFSLSVFA